jgi:MT0933-like antitoxin protein
VDFGEIKDKILGHKDQVDEGIDKAADVAKDKVGHDEQVDQGAEKAKEAVDKLDDN